MDRGRRDAYRAALIGADAMGLAVIATTATIIAVFAPVSVMPGEVGQFFKEFGLTVAAAVTFSLIVARLLTPLMAAYFLKGIGFKAVPDRNYLYIAVQGAPGATREDMSDAVQKATQLILRQPDVEHVFAQVGSTSGTLGAVAICEPGR